MKPENWTGCWEPCFADYDADPMAMTKEQFIAEADNISDCEDGMGDVNCAHLQHGGSWDTCPSGRLSKWCDWLPKEGGPADMPEKMSPDELSDKWREGEDALAGGDKHD